MPNAPDPLFGRRHYAAPFAAILRQAVDASFPARANGLH
jgi:hypothetical protein